MNFDLYKTYTTEDFILDEDFMKLARGSFVDGISLEALKNQISEKRKEIALAAEIINGLHTRKADLSTERKAKLLKETFHANKKKQFQIRIFSYAASILVVLGIGVSVLYHLYQPSDIENFAASSNIRSENVELVLADGKRVEVGSEYSKIEYTADGTTVALNDTSKQEQAEAESGKSFNQVIVPSGKRTYILLSDGSKVWLNTGSKLIYPPVFNKNNREVFLDGEAYFEVSKDKSKPFLVRTDEFCVKVLGTKFNVQSLKDEAKYTALLVEGMVSLSKNGKFLSKEKILTPNQKATLSDSQAEFNITEVEDAQNEIAWIYGYLNFENEDLIHVTQKLAKYYNLKIEVQTHKLSSKFSGKLDLKESAEKVLNGVSTIFKIKYEKQEDKIVFHD